MTEEVVRLIRVKGKEVEKDKDFLIHCLQNKSWADGGIRVKEDEDNETLDQVHKHM